MTGTIQNNSALKISAIFKNRLNELVGDIGCKKSELPQLLKISENVITKALQYGIIPKPAILIRLSDAFQVSIDYLIGKSDNLNFEAAQRQTAFQDRFIGLRDERKLKNSQISAQTPIDRSYFTIWAKKNYLPSLEYLDILADYFKVSIDYLLGRTDDRTNG